MASQQGNEWEIVRRHVARMHSADRKVIEPALMAWKEAQSRADYEISVGLHWHQRAMAVDARLAKVPALVEALRESIDFAEEGWAYASDYFQTKWQFDTRVKHLRDVLAAWESD